MLLPRIAALMPKAQMKNTGCDWQKGNKSMKISIAMATYNGEKYLREQLDSFVAQTRQPDELIVSDDCSDDGTVNVIKAFARQAPFDVRWYVNEENLGFVGNFSRALSFCTGDLVFLSDQDDVWFENKIEQIEAIACEDDYNLLFINDTVLAGENLATTGLTLMGQIRSGGVSESFFTMGACAAVRPKLLEMCLPIPIEHNSHDVWLSTFAEKLGRKRIVDIPLQYYRRHGSNVTDLPVYDFRPITKKDTLISLVKAALKAYGNAYLIRQVLRREMFLQRVQDVRNRMSYEDPEALARFERDLENVIYLTRKRINLKNKARIYRFFPALAAAAKGEYKAFHGIKGALHDIFF